MLDQYSFVLFILSIPQVACSCLRYTQCLFKCLYKFCTLPIACLLTALWDSIYRHTSLYIHLSQLFVLYVLESEK